MDGFATHRDFIAIQFLSKRCCRLKVAFPGASGAILNDGVLASASNKKKWQMAFCLARRMTCDATLTRSSLIKSLNHG